MDVYFSEMIKDRIKSCKIEGIFVQIAMCNGRHFKFGRYVLSCTIEHLQKYVEPKPIIGISGEERRAHNLKILMEAYKQM